MFEKVVCILEIRSLGQNINPTFATQSTSNPKWQSQTLFQFKGYVECLLSYQMI